MIRMAVTPCSAACRGWVCLGGGVCARCCVRALAIVRVCASARGSHRRGRGLRGAVNSMSYVV